MHGQCLWKKIVFRIRTTLWWKIYNATPDVSPFIIKDFLKRFEKHDNSSCEQTPKAKLFEWKTIRIWRKSMVTREVNQHRGETLPEEEGSGSTVTWQSASPEATLSLKHTKQHHINIIWDSESQCVRVNRTRLVDCITYWWEGVISLRYLEIYTNIFMEHFINYFITYFKKRKIYPSC